MDLQKSREKLDEIDKAIVELFEQRMSICGDVAEYKIQTGKAVYDAQREQEKLQAVGEMAHSDFNRIAVKELFSQMMTISRRYQYRLMTENGKSIDLGFRRVDNIEKQNARIVYQGVEGAYSHAAALQYFGMDADVRHVVSWEDAMKAVRDGDADFAVLPIENSSAGAVSDNYDLLMEYENHIVAETFLSVNHALLGRTEAQISDIKTVYSHPQALMQCSRFLNEHQDWKQVSLENTAVAAKKVVEDMDVSQAAVASEIAGKLYGLKVLELSINHNKNNTTRFIILSKQAVYRKDADKVSISFELPHRSGSLYNILGNFIFNSVNMRMIESRPIPGKTWEYRFFIDIEGNLDDPGIRNALMAVSQESANMRILGNY